MLRTEKKKQMVLTKEKNENADRYYKKVIRALDDRAYEILSVMLSPDEIKTALLSAPAELQQLIIERNLKEGISKIKSRKPQLKKFIEAVKDLESWDFYDIADSMSPKEIRVLLLNAPLGVKERVLQEFKEEFNLKWQL